MKFAVTWQINQDKWFDVLKVWTSMSAAERADAGEGVKIIGIFTTHDSLKLLVENFPNA